MSEREEKYLKRMITVIKGRYEKERIFYHEYYLCFPSEIASYLNFHFFIVLFSKKLLPVFAVAELSRRIYFNSGIRLQFSLHSPLYDSVYLHYIVEINSP